MPDLSALIERIEALTATIDGGKGISWSMGADCELRYNTLTGQRYLISRPAELTCSSAKMRAIVDNYALLPDILAALRALHAQEERR